MAHSDAASREPDRTSPTADVVVNSVHFIPNAPSVLSIHWSQQLPEIILGQPRLFDDLLQEPTW
jgi:hypothetical protein